MCALKKSGDAGKRPRDIAWSATVWRPKHSGLVDNSLVSEAGFVYPDFGPQFTPRLGTVKPYP